MKRRIETMRDHFIVCAYGRVGRAVARQFETTGMPYVIVDMDPEKEPELIEDRVVYYIGDGSSEEVLRDVGIERAAGLVCAVDSDAANVYITLTARAIRPDIYIVARASDPAAPDRLRHAGANRVVSPFVNSGRHMAVLAGRPGLDDYLEMAIGPNSSLRVDEVVVEERSEMVGRRLADAVGSDTALGLRRSSGELVLQPPGDLVLEAGDVLLLLGRSEEPVAPGS